MHVTIVNKDGHTLEYDLDGVQSITLTNDCINESVVATNIENETNGVEEIAEPTVQEKIVSGEMDIDGELLTAFQEGTEGDSPVKTCVVSDEPVIVTSGIVDEVTAPFVEEQHGETETVEKETISLDKVTDEIIQTLTVDRIEHDADKKDTDKEVVSELASTIMEI